jgi:hypothetical protein
MYQVADVLGVVCSAIFLFMCIAGPVWYRRACKEMGGRPDQDTEAVS